MCSTGATGIFARDLRLATIVIAVLSLLENVGILVYTSWVMKQTKVFLLYFLNQFKSGEEDLVLLSLYVVAMTILAGILLLSISAMLLDVMLFIGALRRHRGLVKSWLRGHAVVSGAYLLYLWQILVALFVFDKMLLIYTLLVASVLGAATVYFWIVVRRYDLRLKQPDVSTVSASCAPPITDSYISASSQLGPQCDLALPITNSYIRASSQLSAQCDPDKPLPGTHDLPPSYDLMMYQTYLSTVSGGCGPSGTNSYVQASLRRSASCDSDKTVSHTPPPPYASNP